MRKSSAAKFEFVARQMNAKNKNKVVAYRFVIVCPQGISLGESSAALGDYDDSPEMTPLLSANDLSSSEPEAILAENFNNIQV